MMEKNMNSPNHSQAYEKALKKIRAICLVLPEAREVEAWGIRPFGPGRKCSPDLERMRTD
jgi:hypothetical protein